MRLILILVMIATPAFGQGLTAGPEDKGCGSSDNPRFRVPNDQVPDGIRTPLCVEQTAAVSEGDGFEPAKPKPFLPRECTQTTIYRCDPVTVDGIDEGYEVWCVLNHTQFYRTVVRAQ